MLSVHENNEKKKVLLFRLSCAFSLYCAFFPFCILTYVANNSELQVDFLQIPMGANCSVFRNYDI